MGIAVVLLIIDVQGSRYRIQDGCHRFKSRLEQKVEALI